MDAHATDLSQRKDVSPWRERCWATLSWLLVAGGMVGAMLFCIAAVGSSDWIAILMLASIWVATVFVHEYGHVIGARASGMVPWLMQVGPLQFQARGGGWRCRFHRGPRELGGFVMSFVDPHRPASPQVLAMVAAGPAANLLLVLVAVAALAVIPSDQARAVLAAVAFSNLAMGVANLLPRRLPWESDGAVLLRVLKLGKALDHSALDRLNGLSVRGTTADALPSQLLDSLAAGEQPLPLMHLWFVIKAQQNRSDWHSASLMAEPVETAIEDIPAAILPYVSDLIASMRCEIEFSRVMAGGESAGPVDRHLGSEIDWLSPWLRPRCQALAAARAGDLPLAKEFLETSARLAERSIDMSVHACERRIRNGIEEFLGQRLPA